MKIRLGFVSNSSTTSFYIYGTIIPTTFKLDKNFYNKLKESSLREFYGNPDWDETIYLGKSWSNMKDEQTKKEFKDEVEKEIIRLFGEDPDIIDNIDEYEEAYYNG